MIQQLTDSEMKEECIIHALKVRRSLDLGDFCRFFKLYQQAPNMGRYLITVFIAKYRTICL